VGTSYCDIAPGHEWHGPYHEREYGFPLRGDAELFERLILEINQAGLSWLTILKKRDAFRRAYDGFDPAVVARYGARDRRRLLADPGIIRNRLKVEAAIANAGRVLELAEVHGSFAGWIEANHPRSKAEWVTLYRQTFRFTGGEIVGEFLMSIGVLGLIDAASRYQPSTGVPFDAFARRRVHGAMLDALRDMDWAPRSLRKMRRDLDGAIFDEAHKHGLRVAVHATGLREAKDLLRAGVDVFAHMISDVITLCGGENIFADVNLLTPPVTMEAVIAGRPEVILGGASAGGEKEFARRWRASSVPPLSGLPAYYVNPDVIQRQTPRIVEGARAVCAALEEVRRSGR